MERKVLLNPGPATTTDTVKQALVIPDVCPRERAFCDLYADVRERIARLTGDPEEIAAIPVVGCGTAALEAALVSLVPRDAAVLIVDNGDYGARIVEMARVLDVPHRVAEFGWGRPIDLAALDDRLAELKGEVSHLFVVHHETGSGMLNPLDEITKVARRHGVRLLLDAMSTWACLPITVGASGVDALVSSSNKCVQGMAGLGLVIATRALLDEAAAAPRRCFALDVVAEHAHLERNGQSRFTVPPQLVSALHRALVELDEEGLAGRQARYEENMRVLMAGLDELGFELLLDNDQQSRILVAIREPRESWYDFDAMHAALQTEGFTIYPGKQGETPCFRLAVLGAIDASDITAFLAALGRYMKKARG
jgi:2-aminoethylphosphonate aminotransferase